MMGRDSAPGEIYNILSCLSDYLVIQEMKKFVDKAQKKCQLLIGNVQIGMILDKTNEGRIGCRQ